jgi:predicted NBD/HSP70 family sugar kinase
VLAVELGATHASIRLANFSAAPLHEAVFRVDISSGPENVISLVEQQTRQALQELGLPIGAVRSCAIGVPGPIDFHERKVTGPPAMPGWDDVPLAPLVANWLPVPVVIDNEVNAMAIGDYDAKWRRENLHDLLFVKHGTGIGCGIIAGGAIYRGRDGTAGEIGHSFVSGVEEQTMCSCGNWNCLQVVASGGALVRQMQQRGYDVTVAADVSALVRQGDVVAMNLIREAGRALAEVLSPLVNFFNPSAIVAGGSLGALEVSLLAALREVIYARASMFSTRHLRIVPSYLGQGAGLHGATLLALDLAYEVALDASFSTA